MRCNLHIQCRQRRTFALHLSAQCAVSLSHGIIPWQHFYMTQKLIHSCFQRRGLRSLGKSKRQFTRRDG